MKLMVGNRSESASKVPPAATPLVVDLDGRLSGQARRLRTRLAQLAEERLCAREVGLDKDRAYIEDLTLELDATRCSYDGAVILQLVGLRADLDGRRRG